MNKLQYNQQLALYGLQNSQDSKIFFQTEQGKKLYAALLMELALALKIQEVLWRIQELHLTAEEEKVIEKADFHPLDKQAKTDQRFLNAPQIQKLNAKLVQLDKAIAHLVKELPKQRLSIQKELHDCDTELQKLQRHRQGLWDSAQTPEEQKNVLGTMKMLMQQERALFMKKQLAFMQLDMLLHASTYVLQESDKTCRQLKKFDHQPKPDFIKRHAHVKKELEETGDYFNNQKCQLEKEFKRFNRHCLQLDQLLNQFEPSAPPLLKTEWSIPEKPPLPIAQIVHDYDPNVPIVEATIMDECLPKPNEPSIRKK